ncbi:hypothetical protein LG299_04230 [Microbacterium lacus]|uniref:hypothetical protein n=1 Tax=Microbacterium lacus TaxID=415217 RepID=UPI00384C7AC1
MSEPTGAPYAPPPGAYVLPPGYVPGAQYAPPPGYGAPAAYALPPSYGAPATRGSSVLGLVALWAALIAAVGTSIVGAVAGWSIGLGVGTEFATSPLDANFDWSILSPVRGWVLTGESAFWTGTVVGICAIVLGIAAIVKNQRRGAGIAAVIIAALGPIVFAVGVQVLIATGLAAGTSVAG